MLHTNESFAMSIYANAPPVLNEFGLDALVAILINITEKGGTSNEPAGKVKPAA